MTHKFVWLILACCVGMGVFLFPGAVLAGEDDVADEPTPEPLVFLSEVFPAPEEGKEWVELRSGSATTSLLGWELQDGTGRGLILDVVMPPNSFFVAEFSSSLLNNSGDVIELKDDKGNVVDTVSYGDWQDAAVEAPPKGQSISKSADNTWAVSEPTRGKENNNPDLSESEKQDEQEIEEVLPEPEQQPQEPEFQTYAHGDVLINEFVSDPIDDTDEFIEFVNRSDAAVDLQRWWVEDGSGKQTVLSEDHLVILSDDLFVIDAPRGKLNNAGDLIRLFDATGGLINEVKYGNWDGASDPAPRAPHSLARDQHTDALVVTTAVTKGVDNVIEPPEKEKKEQPRVEQAAEDFFDPAWKYLVISAVLPNPVGDDQSGEYIDVQNTADHPVFLSGLSLADEKNQYRIPEQYLVAGSAVRFMRKESGIALNNSGTETVFLAADDQVITRLLFAEAEEGHVYTRDERGMYQWVDPDAPEQEQVFQENFEPEKEGDPPAEVRDAPESALAVASTTIHLDDWPVMVSEVFPNPEGPDTGEFVELYNPTDEPVSLFGVVLDDEDGGSRPFAFEVDDVVGSHGFFTVEKARSGLTFNNTSDSVRLLSEETVLFDVRYDDAQEQAAYAYDASSSLWMWTVNPTPGEPNQFGVGGEDVFEGVVLGEDGTLLFYETTLSDVRFFEDGDTLSAQGVVSVLPGVLSSRHFYIVDSSLATGFVHAGVQIYMHAKDFPELSVGDRVRVTGVKGTAYEETRIRVATKEDIVVIGSASAPVPETVVIQDVGPDREGQLVRVGGEVTERKTSHMYVDDGTEEIKVYIKKQTGIDPRRFAVGDEVHIVGIVGRNRSGLHLFPRTDSDVTFVTAQAQQRTFASPDMTDAHRARVHFSTILVVLSVFVILFVGIKHLLQRVRRRV
jgi:hypothetical protein